MKTLVLLAFLACSPAAVAAPAGAIDYDAQIEAWRSERLERLQRPDGWLSLVGLHWLEPGKQSAGRAGDHDIVLATGPDNFGEFTLFDGKIRFTPATGARISVNNELLAGSIDLAPGRPGAPTMLGFNDGNASAEIIGRGDRFALRVRDANAGTRTGFTEIEHYPVDVGWRFDAQFEPHTDSRTLDIATVINTVEKMPNPGAVVFERDGHRFRLEAVDEGDGRLFLIFADRTNGRETYGPGRFLYADPAVEGRTVVDFNRAYNPPCAFNAHSTCPLPPPQNRLDLAVKAGEKKYRGPT